MNKNYVFVDRWTWPGISVQRSVLTCTPAPDKPFVPACLMKPVEDMNAIRVAVVDLQSKSVPLVLVLLRNCSFTQEQWPSEGLEIFRQASAPVEAPCCLRGGGLAAGRLWIEKMN